MDISLHLLEVTVRDQFFFTEFCFYLCTICSGKINLTVVTTL